MLKIFSHAVFLIFFFLSCYGCGSFLSLLNACLSFLFFFLFVVLCSPFSLLLCFSCFVYSILLFFPYFSGRFSSPSLLFPFFYIFIFCECDFVESLFYISLFEFSFFPISLFYSDLHFLFYSVPFFLVFSLYVCVFCISFCVLILLRISFSFSRFIISIIITLFFHINSHVITPELPPTSFSSSLSTIKLINWNFIFFCFLSSVVLIHLFSVFSLLRFCRFL